MFVSVCLSMYVCLFICMYSTVLRIYCQIHVNHVTIKLIQCFKLKIKCIAYLVAKKLYTIHMYNGMAGDSIGCVSLSKRAEF